MGNTNSNTTTKQNQLPKPYVLGPVNGYNYYNQAAYMPQPYVYPMYVPADYPVDYPVVSDQNTLNNQYAQKKPKSKNVCALFILENVLIKVLFFLQQKPSKREVSPVRDSEDEHQQSAHHRHHHRRHHHRHEPSPTRDHGTSPPPLTMFEERKPTGPPVTVKRIITPTVSVPSTQQPTTKPTQVLTQPPPLPPATLIQRSPTMGIKLSPTPFPQELSPSPPQQPPIVIRSDIFERVPFIEINRVAKSVDNNAIYNYGPGPISIVKHSALRQGTAGNRWYDHDYDKRVKSIVVNDA